MWQILEYQSGFHNEFASEDGNYKGSLPKTINPQQLKFNLVAEQLSGTAFTAPRSHNRRSWLYRKRPSVCHESFERLEDERQFEFNNGHIRPNQTRWLPFDFDGGADCKSVKRDFVEGLNLLAYSNQESNSSVAIYIYTCNVSMHNKSFVNTDGDFLIVPQTGTLFITTEFGKLVVDPNEIAVIQQGMKFKVECAIEQSDDTFTFNRGYVLEVKGNHFELPNLGPIGANCLANARDFKVPVASVVEESSDQAPHMVEWKFQNCMFKTNQTHSPYDVAAWFGNYVPFKYNLEDFVSVNSVSVDHPDPSIFTVITCPSFGRPGVALADFVIFPPRWECANGTFRPPYFHRNCMTEFMGLIKGQYQAKEGGFSPGGASLHQAMIPHGPDLKCFRNATLQDTTMPVKIPEGTMAFMFETSVPLKLTSWAMNQKIDNNYRMCWKGLSQLDLRSQK